MKLLLIRNKFNHNAVIGDLYVDNIYFCYTLENKKYLLKEGIYNIVIRYSPKFKRLMLAIEDNLTIMIHPANKSDELQGCIAVGMIADKNKWEWIGNSRQAEKILYDKIISSVIKREKIKLEIKSV